MESIVIKHVGGRDRAYPTPSTHIRVRCHLGNAQVRYVTSDGYLGLHFEADELPARVDEVRANCVTAVSPGGRPQLVELMAAVAPAHTSRQAIPVIVIAVAA